MRDGQMHQTTVRFGPDLWEALEVECSRLGMSAAQYVREAALARLMYTTGRSGNEDYAVALSTAGVPNEAGVPVEATPVARARTVVEASVERDSEARAVSAQTNLVLVRARRLRDQSVELRRISRSLDRAAVG